jgi:hypothetical protein
MPTPNELKELAKLRLKASVGCVPTHLLLVVLNSDKGRKVMTEQDIMEQLSKRYIEIIANRKGYFVLSGKDYGTDLHIAKVARYGNSFCETGRQVHIQVKSVIETSEHIVETEEKIKDDLRGKNYNDLVFRIKGEGYTPLMAKISERQNKYDKAESIYKQELEIWKKARGPDHVRTVETLKNIERCIKKGQGGKYD